MFDITFKYSWADIDLSLRVWGIGGQVRVCNNAIVKPKQVLDNVYNDHRAKTWDEDVESFLTKWHNRLGEGIPRTAGAVNNPK